MTDYSSELDEILDEATNHYDDGNDYVTPAKAKLEALITEQVVKELESLSADIYARSDVENGAVFEIHQWVGDRINQLEGKK